MLNLRGILEDFILVTGVVLRRSAEAVLFVLDYVFSGFKFIYSNPSYRLLFVAFVALIALISAL